MVDWNRGEPQPSLKERMIQALEERPDRIWTPAEMRGELFPDIELETSDDVPPDDRMFSYSTIAQVNAVVHTTMEILVDEGVLDKREFRVDTVSELTVNEAEYEEVMGQLPEDHDVYTDRTYYRLNKSPS